MRQFIIALALLMMGTPVRAGILLDTVNWAPDTLADGTGTGTLNGGAITVTYTTAAAVLNAGMTLPQNWPASAGSSAVSSVTNTTGGVFGTTLGGTPVAQTIQFSSAVTNPYLLVNFTDAASSMNFGLLPISFLSSNNAQLAAGTVTFVGSTNSFDNGFAAQITGTFGPGSPIAFTYSTTDSLNTAAFTVGLAPTTSAPIPEPATLGMAGAAVLFGLVAWQRKRRRSI